MAKPSILVIDDEPDNFDVVEIYLKEQDYDLHYMANGDGALKSLDLFNPDLILLDVMMPGIDGIEVCRQIKANAQWQAVPIMMVTALTTKKDLAQCLDAGADDFISKPINAVELRARVNSMLRLKRQHDRLQSMVTMKDNVSKMIVHDLRNPLSNILMGLDLIISYPDLEQDKQEEIIEHSYESAQSLNNLIEQILQMAVMEAGQIQLKKSACDLWAIIQSTLANFKLIAAEKDITLSSKLSDAPPRNVVADNLMIQRMLDNLISNALKFSLAHGDITVELDYSDPDRVTIQVIDCGVGVNDEVKAEIFEPYQIGTMMSSIPQIGLGLSFCKMAIEAHGGSINLKDNQPQGSIFELQLPG